MNEKRLQVGVIGADTKASWAQVSHIPAIQGLGNLELAAVATRREESAREAAAAFGAKRWFADPFAMIRDDAIDIVTITVKVPDHKALVLAALDAGKAVYCEAPLGISAEEAEQIAAAAASGHVAIGLQSRLNPAARRATQLIADGKIGQLRHARVISTNFGFGPETLSTYLYFEKAASGANLLTITAGHTLDLVEVLLGAITEVDARLKTFWPNPKVADSDRSITREVADHINVLGKTTSGAEFTANIVGGIAAEDARFEFEVLGTDGWLKLAGGHPYGMQAGDFTLTASVPFDAPGEPLVSGGLLNAALNVGEIYASLARDIVAGTHHTPDFVHALHNTRLMDAVATASRSGKRQYLEAN